MMSALYGCVRPPLRTSEMPALDTALGVARDFSPRLHRYGSDCVVLDVGGLGRLLGDPQTIGRELARAYEERADHRDPRAARIAVAPTQLASMLLSSAHGGLTVVTDDVPAALAPVRLDVLRQVCAEMHGATLPREARSTLQSKAAAVWESAEQAFAVLARWGLTTLGEFAALPADALSARLGQAGVSLQRRAMGIDVGPLVPDPDVPRFLERVELEWPIDGLEPLAFVLARLLEPLSASLERADRGAAAIHLDLRLVDRTRHARVLQLPAAIRDPRVLRTLLVLDLESHPPHAAIDIVTIEVDPAPGRVIQYSLLARARPSAEMLATLMARLGALVGESRCGQPFLLDSYGPDAFEMHRFAPDDSLASAIRRNDPVAFPPTLDNPVASAVTLDPVASAFRRKEHQLDGAVLRRFRPPVAIRVTIDRGRPSYVFVDRRGMPGGHVEQCAGPWRSSGAWWKEPNRITAETANAVNEMSRETSVTAPGTLVRPWNRDEWDVALSDGSVCRLFQARDTERWFLDGVID